MLTDLLHALPLPVLHRLFRLLGVDAGVHDFLALCPCQAATSGQVAA